MDKENALFTADPFEQVSDSVGKHLVQFLIHELNLIQHPAQGCGVWNAMPENMQAEAMDRMRSRIRSELERGYEKIFAVDTPAVRAELATVTFTAGKVQAKLEIPTTAQYRHALSDFAGRHVIVVLPNSIDDYLEGMDGMVAEKDQGELDLDEPAENNEDDYPLLEEKILGVVVGHIEGAELAKMPDPQCAYCKGSGKLYDIETDEFSPCKCHIMDAASKEFVEKVDADAAAKATAAVGITGIEADEVKQAAGAGLSPAQRQSMSLPEPGCPTCAGTGEIEEHSSFFTLGGVITVPCPDCQNVLVIAPTFCVPPFRRM
jgi:hypothetical protein